MRLLYVVAASLLLTISVPVDALHFSSLKQQTLQAREQLQAQRVSVVSVSDSEADALVYAPPVYDFVGVNAQVTAQEIKDAYCLNENAAHTAFLNTDSNFKCTPGRAGEKTFSQINTAFAAEKWKPKNPRHWGVGMMHQTTLKKDGQGKYTLGDGTDGTTFLCAGANADDTKDGRQVVTAKWGTVRFKQGVGGGDHTERMCLDLFGQKLFGAQFVGNFEEDPNGEGKFSNWAGWPAADVKYQKLRLTISFCTELVPCVACSKAIKKFQQGLLRVGAQLGDRNQGADKIGERINAFCY